MCRTCPHCNGRASLLQFALIAVAAFSCLGCSPSAPKYKVRGTVVYSDDKKPIPGGAIGIEFESTKPPYNRSSSTVGPDGSFELSTSTQGDGALEGEHRIRFTGTTSPQQPDAKVALSAVMPIEYYEFSTSGLKFDIKPNDENIVNLEVKKPTLGTPPSNPGNAPKQDVPRDPSISPDT